MKNFALVAVVLASIPGSSFAAQKPSKESLVKAWEAVLKADPDTRVFEKIEEGRYKFKTEAFPFRMTAS